METVMAASMAPSCAWDLSVKAWLGDLEPNGVGRLLSSLPLRVHFANGQPCSAAIGIDARHLSRRHFSENRARPFVIWTAERGSATRRCAKVGAALALPDADTSEALATLAVPSAQRHESQQ